MRVLIVHPYRHVGGVDTFVTNLIRCLVPRGFRFWVLVPEERPLTKSLREIGADVRVEPALRTFPRSMSPIQTADYLIATWRAAQSVRTLVASERINTVHAVQETMWPVLLGLRRLGVTRISSVHGLRFTSPRWAGRVNTKALSAVADRIVCVSRVVLEVFRNWNVTERKLALVPSSVDLERFRVGISGSAFRNELGVPANAPLVGTVGSVDERKGHTYFLEACARVRASRPLARFVIVGHPGDRGPAAQLQYVRELEAQAVALGLTGSLSFVPSRSDIPEVMAALDILVQPSLTEAGPRAPLEAMAMVRPVVGTRVEGTAEEVVDGETGILVEPRDADALARGVTTLIDNPGLRDRMGRAGRARVERLYALSRTADLIQGVYQGAVTGQAG